jgi:hypothetical protein
MNQTLPIFLFLSVASIALFSFISMAVWASERRREREAYYRNETARKIAEMQGVGGDSAIDFIREEEKIAARRRTEGLKLSGFVTLAVGIGMMLFLKALYHDEPGDPVYLVGIIPLLTATALLAYGYLLAPRQHRG